MKERRIHEGIIHGIKLQFTDIPASGSVSSEFYEFIRDDYGLEQIKLNEDDTVIDIGANVGMFSIYVKKKFGCKRIIAFEPVRFNFENFLFNIELNGLDTNDFELHNTAITASEGKIIRIGTPEWNSGGSSVFRTEGNIFTDCKTETLHKYIDDSCKYLKIDTEGAEYEIIPSILDKLNIFDYLGIECHHAIPGGNREELIALIKANFKGKLFYS